MPTIDMSSINIRTANEVIRGFGANHQDVEILNPDAKHYLAVGLTNPIAIDIRGSAGYFCGGLSDGPTIRVEKNVSWGVGDNMLSGTIVVGGNAGAIAGEALRGGEIVIKGNMGSRSGQVMKKGTLCCAGNSSFMAGYMMYGGRIIILGDSGRRVGENMAGGEIFVGGEIESLGDEAMVVAPTEDDIASISAFLETYGLRSNGEFKKIVCSEKGLTYGTSEPKAKRIPFTEFSGGTTDYWNAKVQDDIRVKSRIGRYRIRGYGTARHLPHFSDIAFKKDIRNADIPDDVTARVAMRTLIGDRSGGRALDLSMPVMIAPMSLGALSSRMKVALGIASRLSGICENTGEGGMSSHERAEARQLIAQCLSGRFGWNIHDMKRADGLELYISQGAKPGLGGQLMASKLTEEIAALRGIRAWMDLRSPSRHPDILGGDDLIMKVQEFREAVGGKLPISLKLGGGRTRDDVKIAFKDGIDFVELDGLQGGTGAAGNEVIEYVGIPTVSALMEALDGLSEIDAEGELPIVLMGGIQHGVDAAKAIALGATAVGLGTPMLIAGGCIGCMDCSSGNCPLGMATQEPHLVEKFDIQATADRMHRYLESFRSQMAAVAHALGYADIRQLSRDDLVALTPEAAALTRLPYDPDYARKLRSRRPVLEMADGKETGCATYPRRAHRVIHAMTEADSNKARREMLADLTIARENPFPESRPANPDDVVFLSAALTRLVIDPYREACSTKTRIARTIGIGHKNGNPRSVELDLPYLFTGFDRAPSTTKTALAGTLAAKGCGYIGATPLADRIDAPWFQLLNAVQISPSKISPSKISKDAPDPGASGLLYRIGERFAPVEISRARSEQLAGLVVKASALAEAIPFALENRLDMLLLDGTPGIERPENELAGPPDLTVLRDAIRILRQMRKEEEIALVYFGGLRSGTDVAKVLAMNGVAGVFGVAGALAMGAEIDGGTVRFNESLSADEQKVALENWIKGTAQETTIIAKCTGKTDVHNLEPEDMRTITLATAEALDIPLASGQTKREWF